MLVQYGFKIRREHDLSNVSFETVRDEERFDRNRQYMDALAPVLAEMAYMSGDIDRRVNRMNERIEREAAVRAVARAGQPPDQEAVEQVAMQAGLRRHIKSLQVSRDGLGSHLHTLLPLIRAHLSMGMTDSEDLNSHRATD